MSRHGLLWGIHSFCYLIAQNLRNGLLLLLILSPGLTYIPANAASPPLPFDRWSVARGVISASCPAGYTCNENVSSENMLQRILTRNGSGETYVQVIIEDNSRNNGNHSFETFVNASNDSNQSIPFSEIGAIIPVDPNPDNIDLDENISLSSSNTGVSTKMNIVQTASTRSSPNPMEYSLTLNTGWAVTRGQPALEISQHISDRTPQGIVFDYTFTYTQNRDANDKVTGWLYGIDQSVQNSAVIGAGNGGTRDDQRAVIKRASGDFVRAGSATLPGSVGGGMGGGMGGGAPGANPANGGDAPPLDSIVPSPRITPFPNPPGAPTGNPGMGGGGGGVPPGGTVSWNTGSEVQVIWIGQVCPGCMIGMGGMGGMGGAGSFSFQQYENISTGSAAATRSIQSAAPFTWTNPPFGAQPRL